MTQYRVTAPCVYAQHGRAVMHLHAGAFVDLEDDVAGTVADCVRVIDRSGSAEAPAKELAPEPEDVPEVLDPDGAEAVTAEDSVAAEPEKARRPRRSSDA
jgi:hypothetical protein